MDNPLVELAAQMDARVAMIAVRRAEMDALNKANQNARKVILELGNALAVKLPV
jgi:hypothetical protein